METVIFAGPRLLTVNLVYRQGRQFRMVFSGPMACGKTRLREKMAEAVTAMKGTVLQSYAFPNENEMTDILIGEGVDKDSLVQRLNSFLKA